MSKPIFIKDPNNENYYYSSYQIVKFKKQNRNIFILFFSDGSSFEINSIEHESIIESLGLRNN